MGLFHKRLDSRSYHTHLISLLKNSELHVRISHLPYWTINRPHRFLKIRHSKEEIACDKKNFFFGGGYNKSDEFPVDSSLLPLIWNSLFLVFVQFGYLPVDEILDLLLLREM